MSEEATKWETCPFCKGSGTVSASGKPQTCPNCGGKGVQEVKDFDGAGGIG